MVLVDGVMILGKELRRYPERAQRELRARSAAASVALREGAGVVISLEATLRGQRRSGSRIVAENLEALGVPRARMILGESTRSTREEAIEGARLAHSEGLRRLAVVTSGYHVPRARRYFAEAFTARFGAEEARQRFTVLAPEAFAQRATLEERAWIMEGTPDARCLREEEPTELGFGVMAAALRPLPRALRWRVEVGAGALLRRAEGRD